MRAFSARMVSSSAAIRDSAASASAAKRCSRSTSAANCLSRRSSSATRSLARASSRSRSCNAVEPMQRCAGAGFGLAQLGQSGRDQRLALGGFRLRGRSCRHLAQHAASLACSASATPRHSRQPSADGTASPRPCAPWRRLRDSGSPASPASSGRRSGRRAGRSRPRPAADWFPPLSAAAPASCRRACRPEMPAASSSTRRRCSGLAWMISPMRP